LHRQVNVRSVHSANCCLLSSVKQPLLQVGGATWKGAGIVWQNGYRLANKLTYVCGAAHFSQSASTLQSGDTGLNLNFGNAW